MTDPNPPEKDSTITFNVKRSVKTRWVAQSQKEGKKLKDWVVEILNEKCK